MQHPLPPTCQPTDRGRRRLRFVPALARTIAVHLPETVQALPSRSPRWLTFRLRPEIAAAVEALQARYAGNHEGGPELTASETLAAVLTEGLPIIASRPEFR